MADVVALGSLKPDEDVDVVLVVVVVGTVDVVVEDVGTDKRLLDDAGVVVVAALTLAGICVVSAGEESVDGIAAVEARIGLAVLVVVTIFVASERVATVVKEDETAGDVLAVEEVVEECPDVVG